MHETESEKARAGSNSLHEIESEFPKVLHEMKSDLTAENGDTIQKEILRANGKRCRKLLKYKREAFFASELMHSRFTSQLLMPAKTRSLVLTGGTEPLEKG